MAEISDEWIEDAVLANRRMQGCWCDGRPAVCQYHEGMLDGLDLAQRRALEGETS